MQAVRFHFDGERLRESQSPEELEMEDGDCIDVSVEQVGLRDWTPADGLGPHVLDVDSPAADDVAAIVAAAAGPPAPAWGAGRFVARRLLGAALQPEQLHASRQTSRTLRISKSGTSWCETAGSGKKRTGRHERRRARMPSAPARGGRAPRPRIASRQLSRDAQLAPRLRVCGVL